ncbi:protoporphyrinogen oxidase [Corynebacterium imitans]|uniref:protoporphyrinogen oxidase n=1 Tax=Corynebacterium imitans TaxID=156978 RepID=UPI001EF32746|nr:protoporphyrinogen oxidase [Corynebacterium imitans]MCG7278679.1 protoporphyrinogen oxidase [Corynebacterium imitans]
MNIAIVGAGLAGLTAAFELRDSGHTVDVYEGGDRIGGKLYTVAFDGGPTDMGAEAFIVRRPEAKQLVDELGLADSLVSPSGMRSLLYVDGETRAMPAGGVMGIPSTSEPVAHLVSEETARRIDEEGQREGFAWTVGGDMSVGALVRERYGDDVVDNIVSSLLGGVYSCTADDLGVRATVPQLAEEFDRLAADGPVHLSTAVANLEAARKKAAPSSGKPAPIFATFREGYQELYEALAEKSGANIYVDAFISAISREGEGYRLKGGEDTVYDRVLLATPAPTTALLLRGIAPEAAETLRAVKLANSAVVGLRFATDEGLPENSGVLVGTDAEDVHAKAFTLSSRKWPHLAERGGALVRASFGRYGDTVAMTASEDDLVDWALDDLQTITGFDGRAAGVEEIFVQRWFGGLPRYDETHLATVASVKDALADVPGVGVAGAWVAGVGVPAVIGNAREAARRLV